MGDRYFRSSRDRICGCILEFGLLGLIIFSPLPAASVYEWSILVIQLVVLIMLIAYVVMKEKPRINSALNDVVNRVKLIGYAFWIFVIFQIVPFPMILVKILSPGVYHYQRLYSADFSDLKFMSFSLIPSLSFQRGLELISYFFLALLVLMTVTKRKQILRIWIVLISVGFFEAFYGLFQLYNKNPRILFYRKIYNLDSATGTFVNRNHFSGYLEMILPLAIGFLIARTEIFSRSSVTIRERLPEFQKKGFAQKLIVLLGVIAMAIAIIFSRSRSGLFILPLIFILFFGLVTSYFEIYPINKKWIKNDLKIGFVIILVVSFYFGIDATLNRFSLDSFLHEARPTYWAHSLKLISNYPLMGTGLGTFGALAPNLESGSDLVAMVHAHNDYLEYLSELGLIGFGLFFGCVFFIIVISFVTWSKRTFLEVKGLALGGIISLMCILTHSITDFNLHIPANMLLFSVVLPLTLVSAFYKRVGLPLKNK